MKANGRQLVYFAFQDNKPVTLTAEEVTQLWGSILNDSREIVMLRNAAEAAESTLREAVQNVRKARKYDVRFDRGRTDSANTQQG